MSKWTEKSTAAVTETRTRTYHFPVGHIIPYTPMELRHGDFESDFRASFSVNNQLSVPVPVGGILSYEFTFCSDNFTQG